MRQGLAAVDWLGSLTIVGATLMILLGIVVSRGGFFFVAIRSIAAPPT